MTGISYRKKFPGFPAHCSFGPFSFELTARPESNILKQP